MITYEEIQKANEGLASIDFKGKDYVLVAQRVKAFRMLFPEGFIRTELINLENGFCLMQARVGYYSDGKEIVLGTGMAFEKQESSFINKTSFIENCETSAVGRALGFLALGIDSGIASAEELTNAIRNQKESVIHLPAKSEQPQSEKTVSLDEIRAMLDTEIKSRTKDMSREEKIDFLNTVVTPALQGQRNWKTCENVDLLGSLLDVLKSETA